MTTYYLSKRDFPYPEKFIINLIQNKYLNNIKLWLDKYCFFDEGKNKFNLESQIKLFRNEKMAIPFSMMDLQSYKGYLQRFDSLCKSLKQQGYSTKTCHEKVKWRLIVGLGHESVYETSITLHRNYSVPIIPASAVKGLVHNYTEKYKKLAKDEVIEILGTQSKKGKVIFFDALPVIEEKKDFIVLDVMNVHYRDYYQDESDRSAPGDWINPNPVFFLAVEGINFRFVVASRDINITQKAMKLLKEAIRKAGVGAKTSAGYGYFEC